MALMFGGGKRRRPVVRKTALPHRGRRIVVTLEIGDLIGLRLERTRRIEYMTVAAIYDAAVKQRVACERAQKKLKRRS